MCRLPPRRGTTWPPRSNLSHMVQALRSTSLLRHPHSRDVCSLTSDDRRRIGRHRVNAALEEMVAVSPLMWIVAAVLLVAAALLLAGVGTAGLWMAVIAVGIAVVAIDPVRRRHA